MVGKIKSPHLPLWPVCLCGIHPGFFSCLGQSDSKNQVSTLHNASKAGFTSIYESRVTSSVQNIFPKVFGKGDSHQYLPEIWQLDKWDDGTDGLMYQITCSMKDMEFQLSSATDSILDSYPEAWAIASQCLFKAKHFVIDFCSLCLRTTSNGRLMDIPSRMLGTWHPCAFGEFSRKFTLSGWWREISTI